MADTAFRPVCFVVMPFGVKATDAPSPAPQKVDFDKLWRDAIHPALEKVGYRAVRADQDLGPLIIKEMLERLYYSDLVVADVSIANANAYYEVGIRHAARSQGCVLIAAEWARPVFDLAQIRHISYPYSGVEAAVDATASGEIIDVLVRDIPERAKSPTPMLETIPDYQSGGGDGARARQLADQLEAFEHFVAKLETVRQIPDQERPAAVDALLGECPAAEVRVPSVAFEMVKFVRDAQPNWSRTVAYIDALPEPLRGMPLMQEQRALALSKQGDHFKAIAALRALIQLGGDTSERQGLLGGRYKKLWNESVKQKAPRQEYLEKAIEHYERGMLLDLNDYYPSCNLPALYRERAGDGDEARAIATAAVARTACERAVLRQSDDEWLRPTLLGLAFAERNAAAAAVIAKQVERERGAGWKLETTVADLRRHVAQTGDDRTRAALAAIAERLAALIPPA